MSAALALAGFIAGSILATFGVAKLVAPMIRQFSAWIPRGVDPSVFGVGVKVFAACEVVAGAGIGVGVMRGRIAATLVGTIGCLATLYGLVSLRRTGVCGCTGTGRLLRAASWPAFCVRSAALFVALGTSALWGAGLGEVSRQPVAAFAATLVPLAVYGGCVVLEGIAGLISRPSRPYSR